MSDNSQTTILIVEDEPFVQMLLTDFLTELGHATLTANDAAAALSHLQSPARIDLLLTDMGLPGMNGRELAEAARRQRPDLPVLFATGYGDNHEDFAQGLPQGMAIIAKPFEMQRLAEILRELISANRNAAERHPAG